MPQLISLAARPLAIFKQALIDRDLELVGRVQK